MMGPFRYISGTGSHVTISWSVQLVATETLIGGLLGTAWKSHGQQYTSVHITSILVEWGVLSYKPFNSLYTKIFVQLKTVIFNTCYFFGYERSKNVPTIIPTWYMQSAVYAHRPNSTNIHTDKCAVRSYVNPISHHSASKAKRTIH